MSEFDCPIDKIDASGRLRPKDPARVAAQAVMFEDAGQLQAIEVRPRGDGWKLTFGLHRLEAARLLGWPTIRAVEKDRSDDEARLAEIDENLGRNELSAIDRAIFLAERKRVFEKLHPEARHGAAPKGKGKVAKLATFAQRFTKDVADRCDLSERTVQRACQLAEELGADLIALLRGTPLADNQAQLFALARLEPTERKKVAKLLAAGEAPSLSAAMTAAGLKTAVDADEAAFRALVSAWTRAGTKARRRFRKHIEQEG
jgi:ParB family chromosome partitioning protein